MPARGAGEAQGGEARAPFNIMLSAAGRRVALLNLLQQSLRELGQPGLVLATDISRCSSAFQLADASRLVPSYSAADCLEQMLEICQAHAVRLIVPTIDPDLSFFSRHQQAFEQIGVQVIVGSMETVRICNDKQATHD